MKTLTIQVHPDQAPDADIQEILLSLAQVTSITPNISEAVGNDGQYCNISITVPDPSQTWKDVEAKIFTPGDPLHSASAGIIVVCEGDHGWDDYSLLYHFDKSKTLDSF